VHHSHNCIAGTSDYLAPELLQLRQERAEAADSRMNWRDAYRPGLTDLSPSQRWDDSSVESTPAREQADAPRADGEGSYGPDVDWWGVGLILYEMTHSVLPFQGTPTQVVEQKLNFAVRRRRTPCRRGLFAHLCPTRTHSAWTAAFLAPTNCGASSAHSLHRRSSAWAARRRTTSRRTHSSAARSGRSHTPMPLPSGLV
jgi:serine/threonine protein kinase